MHALILAGGKGTRLRPLTTQIPKPIVPLMNRPFAHYQIDSLVRSGIDDVVLSLNYQPDKISSILGDGSEIGAKLRFAVEPSPLGTAGAYKFAAGDFPGTTIVLNGDIFTDIDFAQILQFHQENRSMATLALYPVTDPTAYGVVVADEKGRIKQFVEKPSKELAKRLGACNINAGIYVLEPEILELVKPSEPTSFEYDIFPKILQLGLPFYGFVMSGNYWRDIGSPQSYLAAHMDCLSGVMAPSFGTPFRQQETRGLPMAIVSEDCLVSEGARIVNSVLGPGTHVEESALIENSVIWSNSRISSSAQIKSSVIGDRCHIGKNVSICNGVLGERTFLADYSRFS